MTQKPPKVTEMTEKPPSFGDVYEWSVRTGVVRWFVIGPSLSGVPDQYEALLLHGPRADPAMNRVTPILISPNENAAVTRVAEGPEGAWALVK